MMDSNETLHCEVLELLGFELIWSTGGGIYHLRRNGGLTIGGGVSIDKAWAQAPTLEKLMLPLMVAMLLDCDVLTSLEPNGYASRMMHIDKNRLYVAQARGLAQPTIPEAIAALFVSAVKAELIDASKVVLS